MNRFTLRRLTWLEARASKLEEATQYEEALSVREQHCQELARHFVADHPAHLEGLQRLAVCQRNAGRPADAEKTYRTAINQVEELEKEPDWDSESAALAARLLNGLGVLLCSQRRPDQALDPLRHALELSSSCLPSNSPALPRVHSNLASALYTLGRYESAKDHYQQALALLRDLPPSADRVHGLADLAECLVELDDPSFGVVLEETLEQARTHLADEAGELARVLFRLANLAERTRQRSTAIDLLEEAVEVVGAEPKHASLQSHCLDLLGVLQKPRL